MHHNVGLQNSVIENWFGHFCRHFGFLMHGGQRLAGKFALASFLEQRKRSARNVTRESVLSRR